MPLPQPASRRLGAWTLVLIGSTGVISPYARGEEPQTASSGFTIRSLAPPPVDSATTAAPLALSQPAASQPSSEPSSQPADVTNPDILAPTEPNGAAGPLSVRPYPVMDPSDYALPVGDRWRIPFPPYDRLGRRTPLDAISMGAFSGNYQYVKGLLYDPYNQNVLKGDYPIIGQHLFFNMQLTSETVYEFRRLPTPAGDSTERPDTQKFFGNPHQNFFLENLVGRFEIFHGDSAFKPFDWKFRVTPVLNVNDFEPEEQGISNIDVRRNEFRRYKDFAIQELFLEVKLADLSPQYDFVSVRGGRQSFVSDFRGFIFNDVNQGVRLFGSSEATRNQWNLLWFYQAEKDTNSELNTWDARHQNVVVANFYRQDALDFDFLPPSWRKGYTSQVSFVFNYDNQNTQEQHFDKNGFLTRPDPIGSFTPRDVEASYFGWTGDGHIGRVNINHAFYEVVGVDRANPIAGKSGYINAQLAAIEPSIDFDWLRLRSSFLWASGDKFPQDDTFRGFDGILENVNFAGGPFSFWNRNSIKLLGVNLVQRNSPFPDLSSSKIEGESNFVNPGIFIVNAGADAEITPKLKAIFNASYLWFAHTESLELYLKQTEKISREIGADLGVGLEYRPLLNNNIIFSVGFSTLIPGEGFSQIYETEKPFYSVFTTLTVTF